MNNVIEVHGKKFKKWIEKSEINQIISSLASKIHNDYLGKHIVFIIVLKGAMFFAAELIRNVNLECEIQFIKANSYGNAMSSSGNVKITGMDFEIKGKDVIIIEDIIDTGLTMKKVTDEFKKSNPKSLEIASLLSKPDERKTDLSVKYLGREIPSMFVIGYGLDYNEAGRQLPDIYLNID